jgi:XTP/dITP diphosphohydrolase
MHKLLIATNNAGKQKEIRSLLKDLVFDLVTPFELNLDLEVEEDGTNYKENAAKKAVAFAQASGLISLSDDTGLEVDTLGGAPGLYSARYAPKPDATDADRRAYLLEQLHSLPQPWKACFRCVIAIATPTGELKFTEGICPGVIIPNERGTKGFGYDPLFLIPSTGRTMAELSMEEKNRLSHRALAVLEAQPTLIKLLVNN